MASKKDKAAKPAVSTTQPPALDLALLSSIVAATHSGQGFMYVTDSAAAPLIAAGLVEVNPDRSMTDGVGGYQTRSTTKGEEMTPKAETAQADAQPAAQETKSAFTIVTGVPMPETQRKGVQRTESYPFGKLEVGQSFFIAATEKKPNPERSYASTVASARNRYAQKHATEKRTNRKGREVPVMAFTRDFGIRRVDDGAPYGQPGVKGAAVWRTK